MRVTTLIAGSTVGGGLVGAAGGKPGSAVKGAGGRWGGRWSGLFRRLPWIGTALAGAGVATALARGDTSDAARQGGGLVGGAGGAALGAAVGSVVPVIGTAIGAGVGSVLGGYVGAGVGSVLGGYVGAGVGGDAASAVERAAGKRSGEPTAVETAAGVGVSQRQRRRERRRRWLEGEDERRSETIAREQADDVLLRPGPAVIDNRGQDKRQDRSVTIRIEAPTFHSASGDPGTAAREWYEQLIERIRNDLKLDEERIIDLTFSDPDPTLE